MIVGAGEHTYEWLGDWAKLPAGVVLGYTHGVVTDAEDNVYIHNQSKDAVCVFDREGNFLRSWGEEYQAGAHGMFLNREKDQEYLYFADYERHIVTKTTLDGREIFRLGVPDRPDIYAEEKEYRPTDVAVAPDGFIYVFDGYGKPWVHRYGPDGRYIHSFGGEGSAPGQLKCPHGGWVDTRRGTPELYVADRGNNRIQVFTLNGKHVRFITDEMKAPCCFFQFGDQMVVPDLQARVTILDKDDKPAAVLGDNPEAPKTQGWPNIQPHLREGRFNSPHAACVDSRGDIYVVEWINTGRITKLRKV